MKPSSRKTPAPPATGGRQYPCTNQACPNVTRMVHRTQAAAELCGRMTESAAAPRPVTLSAAPPSAACRHDADPLAELAAARAAGEVSDEELLALPACADLSPEQQDVFLDLVASSEASDISVDDAVRIITDDYTGCDSLDEWSASQGDDATSAEASAALALMEGRIWVIPARGNSDALRVMNGHPGRNDV